MTDINSELIKPLLDQNDENNSENSFPMSLEVQRSQDRNFKTIKILVLVWLTFQNSIHTLLLRYSRVRIVPEMFYSSVAVFWMEILKLIFCLCMVFFESNGFYRSLRVLKKQVFDEPWDTLKVCIPAMLYTLQNNLFYTAASHLDAATFMVVSQLKIFSTAIFSIILLKRSLISIQWVALIVLFIGVSLVQLQSNSTIQKEKNHNENRIIGFTTACFACTISGFAGVFFEKILKGSAPVSIWMRNVQMSIFSIPCSFVALLIQDGFNIAQNGFFYGFDLVVWITILWYCIGGLSVAVCIKYADNIAKNFATSVAIILATVGSVYIFNFVPNFFFILGAFFVIMSIFMYSSSFVFLNFFNYNSKI